MADHCSVSHIPYVTLAYLFFADTSEDAGDAGKPTGDIEGRREAPRAVALSPEDIILLARLRGENDTEARAAFNQLFEAHYDAVCDYAARIVRDTTEAEDLAQVVFGRVFERRTQIDVRMSLRGYLLRAVRREALHTLRHARVVAHHADAAAEAVQGRGGTPNAEMELATAELVRVIDHAVAQLPARCQEAFSLRWRYELSYTEVAETMRISVKTVEMQLTRALKMVRGAVKAYLDEGTTG